MPDSSLPLAVRLKFNDEAGRHSFMMQAIHRDGFEYKLEQYDTVLTTQAQADALAGLAKEFGGMPEPVIDRSREPREKRAFSHEERIEAWDRLIGGLERDLNRSPNKLTIR